MSDLAALHQELSGIFEGRGQARYGLESISQLQHALQAAALAERDGEPPALVLAALLHDVGHLVHAMGENPAAEGRDDHHERIGAKWLSKRLPRSVTEPIRLHVAAKRYLCTTDSDYAAKLAPDSVLSLKLQGGPMSADEANAFVKEPFAGDAVKLRRLDEAAKDPNAATPPFAHFLRHLAAARIGQSEREMFARDGVCILREFFTTEDARVIADFSSTMGKAAADLLAQANREGLTPAALAREAREGLIVVPEADDPAKVCRFEFLQGAYADFRAFVKARIAPAIEGVAGEAFVPFKDKENEKHPGGGAFRAHQDFAAYQAFGPRYNITAMVSVDVATCENGCLEFAQGWQSLAQSNGKFVESVVDDRPLFRFHKGGPRNGDILDEIETALEWNSVATDRRDLVLFDSYVPHRSAPNTSIASRRALFLTFNAAREGDWYGRYYDEKRACFDDPKFHVSTPTSHS